MVAMLLVGIVPLVGMSAYAFVSQRDALRDGALDRLAAAASLQESRIEDFVQSRLDLTSLVTSRTQLRASVAGVIATGDAGERERAAAILRDARAGTRGILAISVADAGGTVVASTEAARVGEPVADSGLVARGRLEPVFGPATATDGVVFATVAAPAGLPGGATAIVLVDVSLEPLGDLARDTTGLGATGETVVAQRGPGGTAVFVTPARFDPDAAPMRRVDTAAGSDARSDARSDAVARAVAGEETLLTDARDYRGERVLAATRNVPSTGWGVVVKIDRSEAFAPVARLRNLLAAGIAAALVVTAVLAWLLARSLTRPLRALRKTAEAVRAGDLDRRARVGGGEEVSALAVAFNDMTERLLAVNRTLEERVQIRTAELAASETRFRRAFDGAPVGMAVVSLDGRYLEVNPSLCELLGRRQTELLRMRWADVTHPDDRALARKFFDDSLATGRTHTIEKRHVTADGSPVWVLLSLSVIRDQEEAPVRFLAHVQDIGVRKEAEQALARSNEALEQFAYVASHDLQEPLRVVTGFVDLLERRYAEEMPEGATELLGYVREGVARMRQLLDDLLDLARVQRQEVERRPVPVAEVVEAVLTDLSAAIDDAGVEVEVEPGGLPTVQADRGLLTRALHNLVANAVKFRSPERRPVVRIGARAVDGAWRIEVADNGIGIDPDDRERVFGMFERLHSREEYPGTGIGLALVRACVERLGGRVGVDETPGGGSTFWLTLVDSAGAGPTEPARAQGRTNLT